MQSTPSGGLKGRQTICSELFPCLTVLGLLYSVRAKGLWGSEPGNRVGQHSNPGAAWGNSFIDAEPLEDCGSNSSPVREHFGGGVVPI